MKVSLLLSFIKFNELIFLHVCVYLMSAVIYDGLSDVSTRMCNVSFENIFIKHPNIYTNIAMGVTIIK